MNRFLLKMIMNTMIEVIFEAKISKDGRLWGADHRTFQKVS